MVLTSFSREEYEKTIRDESYEMGKAEERALMKQVYRFQRQGKTAEEIALELKVSLEDVKDMLEL